jgi:hypothetical protein
MTARFSYSVHVEPRCLAGSDMPQPWAVIRDGAATVWQFGPYSSDKEARSAARFRLAQHYSGSHRFGGRVNLPGQLELPDTEPRPIDVAKRQAVAPLKPSTAQKPCDIGLFSDTPKQVDLEDLL